MDSREIEALTSKKRVADQAFDVAEYPKLIADAGHVTNSDFLLYERGYSKSPAILG